jgi:hypothetical protein
MDTKKMLCDPDEVLWSPKMHPNDGRRVHRAGKEFSPILLIFKLISILTAYP